MTQQEFDELDAIVVHLIMDGTKNAALCSGETLDPDRWKDSKKIRKQCQSCLLVAMRNGGLKANDGPVKITRDRLQYELTSLMRKILSSCVTRAALDHPSSMTFDDIILNLHLFERLGAAHEAVKTLRGYSGVARGFELIEESR